MEFWRSKYHEYLNAEGAVTIVGSEFSRSRILSELEPETYSLSFGDWVESRKQTLTEFLFDQIFETRGNKDRFLALKKAVSYEKVVPFIGAGLSMPSGLPSWTAFLWQVQGESHVQETELNSLLQFGNYEQAAQLLYNDLGGNLFNKHLQECFDQQTIIQGSVNLLPIVFPKQNIITTNFDKFLESLFKTNQGFDQVLSGSGLEEAFRLMSQGGRFLCKLHGSCDVITNRVLTETEYEESYVKTGLLKRFLERIAIGNSLLFIGCSLTTDRTIKILEELVNENSGLSLPQHYAFLELNTDTDKVERQKTLAKANIFPIWYPEGEHDESIEALLLALVDQAD